MCALTEQVIRYQETGEGRTSLVQTIALTVYRYPKRRYGLTEDDNGEFLLFFYPRISALLRRFKPVGKPFEAYLYATIRWQIRSYVVHKQTVEQRMRLTVREDLWENTVCPDDEYLDPTETVLPIGNELPVDTEGRFRDRRLRRRVLLVALKAAPVLTPAQISRVARLIDRNVEWMEQICHALRRCVEGRRQRHEELAVRRNRAYVRLQCLEDQVRGMQEGERKELALAECKRIRRRYERARREALAVLLTPTNREIAEVLGIPKGSIDSAIFYARRAWVRGTILGR